MSQKIGLKSGTCPQCRSGEVYCADKTTFDLNSRKQIPLSVLKFFCVEIYTCVNCGLIEEYMIDKHLQDEKRIGKIKESWKKIL